MRLEVAYTAVLQAFFPTCNICRGGNGALGLRIKGAKTAEGKQLHASDPGGYRVYVVLKLKSEGCGGGGDPSGSVQATGCDGSGAAANYNGDEDHDDYHDDEDCGDYHHDEDSDEDFL